MLMAGRQGSQMRAIARFAVICVSLLISLLISLFLAAQAGAAGPRTPINALDFQERGARLRLELERAYQDLRHTGEFKVAGNDVSSIVQKYVPAGTSFADAAITLRSSGFDVDPLPPPEPPQTPSPGSSDEQKSAISGRLILAQHGVSRIVVEIKLLPKISVPDLKTIKSVRAKIYYRGV
jgi:hypothetical protein